MEKVKLDGIGEYYVFNIQDRILALKANEVYNERNNL
jgi:hypothetical protein